MKSATPQITDANVRRLQQLQDAVDSAFSTHVSRHKAEIERHHAYFRENFPLLGVDLRAACRETAEQSEETSEELMEMGTKQNNEGGPQDPGLSETDLAAEDKRAMDWRRLRAERGRFRKSRRRRHPPRLHPEPTAPAPETSPPPSAQPEPFTAHSNAATEEENRVLEEIAKLELMLAARKRAPAPQAAPAPASGPDEPPTQPARQGFFFGNLFDLKPRFRELEPEDSDDTES